MITIEKHCPNCHKNNVPIQWICGCIRCPECTYCYKTCISLGTFKIKHIGICNECKQPIFKQIPDYKIKNVHSCNSCKYWNLQGYLEGCSTFELDTGEVLHYFEKADEKCKYYIEK